MGRKPQFWWHLNGWYPESSAPHPCVASHAQIPQHSLLRQKQNLLKTCRKNTNAFMLCLLPCRALSFFHSGIRNRESEAGLGAEARHVTTSVRTQCPPVLQPGDSGHGGGCTAQDEGAAHVSTERLLLGVLSTWGLWGGGGGGAGMWGVSRGQIPSPKSQALFAANAWGMH